MNPHVAPPPARPTSSCPICGTVWLSSHAVACPRCDRSSRDQRELDALTPDQRRRRSTPVTRATARGLKIGRSLAGEGRRFGKYFQDFMGRWWSEGREG